MATGFCPDTSDGQSVNGPQPEAQRQGDPETRSNVNTAAVVLDKLAELDVARKAERERRREESRAAADPRESVARFLKNFAALQRNIDDALQRMLASHHGQQQPLAALPPGQQQHEVADQADQDASGITPLAVSTSSPEEIQASLDLVSAEVQSLEQAAATASYYLPPYDQKQCAASIASLRASIEAARTAIVPRRRFAFGSKKVSKVRGEEVSAAAAATAATGVSTGTAFAVPTETSVTASIPSASDEVPQSSEPAGARIGAPADISQALSKEDDDTPVILTVSEQDRALVARGRGLLGLTDATIALSVDEVSERGAGGDFVLLGLTRCRVVLLGRLRALRIAGMRGCTVVAGPVTGACLVDDVRGSSLSLATYQVRIHRTLATDLFLRVRSNPIIEHSTEVRVAPWTATVESDARIEQLLQAHMLGEETGCWQKVDDFGWIKSVQSPNWCILPPGEYPREPIAVPSSVWESREEAVGTVGGSSGGTDTGKATPASGDTDEV